jgi:hypothetical protein
VLLLQQPFLPFRVGVRLVLFELSADVLPLLLQLLQLLRGGEWLLRGLVSPALHYQYVQHALQRNHLLNQRNFWV